MHRSCLRALVIAVVLAPACARPERNSARDSTTAQVVPPPAESLPAAALSSTDSARALYWSFAERLGESRSHVIATLGAPASTTGDTLRNQHDPTVVDSLVTLRYAGMSVQFFVGSSGNEFPTAVSVTDSAIALPVRLGIGASRAEIERSFGTPDYERSQGDSLLVEFVVPSPGIGASGNQLTFAFVGGTVRSIHWIYYID
jgi:hypothetical protein